MRKIVRQDIVTLPKQSLTAMKVAFGIRAQYATIAMLSMLMLTQVIGVVIFSGKAQANGSITLAATITAGYGESLSLDAPPSIAIAPDDSFYVVSYQSNKVTKYNSSNVATGVIGASGSGDGQFDGPSSLAVDADGNLFVFDRLNYRVQKFDSNGTFVTKWGAAGSGDGQFGFLAVGGFPHGMSIAPNGDLYVSDYGNDRIQVFDTDGNFLRSWSISNPHALAVDSAGRVWVCATPSVSGVLAPYTSTGTRIGGDDLEVDNCSGGLATSSSGDLFYIWDGTIVKLNYEARTTATLTINFGELDGIAINSQGKIYVTNQMSDRIQIYNDNSAHVQATTNAATEVEVETATLQGNTSISGITAKGFQFGTTTSYELPGIPNTSAPTAKPLRYLGQTGTARNVTNIPQGLAIASDGNYYVADGNPSGYNIKKLRSTDGYLLGTIDADYYGINPGKMTVDSEGNLYVVNRSANDDSTDHIWKFHSSGYLITSWGINGVGDGEFTNATDVAVDSHNNVYVADRDGSFGSSRIQKFDSAGTFSTKWGNPGTGDGQFGGGITLAVGADDSVYVLDFSNDRIQKFNNTGTFISKWSNPGSGDGHWVEHVSVMSIRGNYIYIADNYGENRLLTFTTDGVFVSSTKLLGDNNDFLIVGHIKVDDLGNLVMLKAPTSPVDAIQVYKPDNQIMSNYVSDLDCGTTYHYRAYATNMYGTVYGADQQFSTNACLEITTTSLPDADLGQDYNATIMHNDVGQLVLTSVIDGDFPPNVRMHLSGDITGEPTEAGLYTFTVRASTVDSSQVVTRELSIFVNGTDLDMIDSSNTINVGEAYSDQIQITGGLGGEVEFSENPGGLPPGLTMDSNGLISGTPTIAGSFSVPIQVTESFVVGNRGWGQDYLIGYGTVQFEVQNLNQHDPLAIYGVELTDGRVGAAYTNTSIPNSRVYGGFGYKSYEVTGGNLPSGLSLDIDGEIHGTPTTAGDYSFTVEVSDLTGSASAEFYITILPVLPPRTNTPIVSITSPSNSTVFDYLQDDVTVSGTGPASQTITIFMDGYELGTTTADGSGNWSYVASDVFPGNHSLDAKWIPIKDVAFVASMKQDALATDVKIIDTASKQVIKTLYLPQYAYATGSTINHAGTKLYLSGHDISTYKPTIWEYDIASGTLTRTLATNDLLYAFGPLAITDDDRYAYASSIKNERAVNLVKIDLATLQLAEPATQISLSNLETEMTGNGTLLADIRLVLSNNKLYLPQSATTDSLEYATAVDAVTKAISGIHILDEPRWDEMLVPIVTSAGDKVYYLANNQLITVNPVDDSVVSRLVIDEFEDANNAPMGLAVDPVRNTAYVGAVQGVYSVNMTTGDAVYTALSGPSPSNYYASSLHLTSDGSQLYIVTLAGAVQIMDTTTKQLVSGAENLLINQFTGYTFSYGNYLGQITPPIATTTFSVGLGPNVIEAIKICNGNQRESIPVGQPYSRQTCTTGGSGPKTFTLGLDPLPTGLSLNSVTGEITGTPTAPGTYGFSVTVTDSTGSDTREYTIVVLPEEDPIITNVTPPITPAKPSPIKTTKTVAAAQNNIFALAKRIPEPFALGFPWFLLALALVLVGIQYYQVHSEAASIKRMQASVANQERLVDEQNNFVALSTHYLHTPLTVMEGEISLMVKVGTLTQAQATKLKATLTSLNAEAEAVLAQEEQNE